MNGFAAWATLTIGILLYTSCADDTTPIGSDIQFIQLNSQKAQKRAVEVRKEVALEVHPAFEVNLWATDSLLSDPIAISIDPAGRMYYVRSGRKKNSELDIRRHRNWMTPSISFETVEDKRNFLRETFSRGNENGKKFLRDLNKDGSRDWKDLAVQKEQIWVLEDTDNDEIADRASLYLEDFHQEVSDVAYGVLHLEDEVYIAISPDLWKTADTNGDSIVDKKESISHGYGVHIGYSAHGMSGITVGPAGRIWWAIGDYGMNVVDKTGKRWKFPNQGVVVRSDPDGSNFEVFSSGLRNTHEFDFDKYGNLITIDNDGDHSGERERLVYLVDGSDSGWRINWQFGKYTDPNNNKYKVWMDEKMSIPHWEGQAAYFLPPISNYVSGPAGFVYNPGTALSSKWKNYFFVSEFNGSPVNSPIHAFRLRPKGASFELDTSMVIVSGMLSSGMDFGPDGALYLADWIEGWGQNGKGRVWKMESRGDSNDTIRSDTKKIIQSDITQNTLVELDILLGHMDKRVRQKAQFELVRRGTSGEEILAKAITPENSQLKRIHGIWGIAQIARQYIDRAEILVKFLNDADAEIAAQAAKWIGDVGYNEAGEALIPLLKHESQRIRFFAAQALGRISYAPATHEILQMLRENNDEDLYLRHAGSLALARIGDAEALISIKNSNSIALKTAALVALRRMNHKSVAEFLKDSNEYIVAEAARAIHDDYSIEQALPSLAELLNTTSSKNEVIIRRAISANLRLGEKQNLQNVVNYVKNESAPDAMRDEALAVLSTWHEPSPLDRVDGRYRGEVIRNKKEVVAVLTPVFKSLLNSRKSKIRGAAITCIGKLGISDLASELRRIFISSTRSRTQRQILLALAEMSYNGLTEVLEIGLKDNSLAVRSQALVLIPESNIPVQQAVSLYGEILGNRNASTIEKQIALASLGKLKTAKSSAILETQFLKFIDGKMTPEIQLDLVNAIESLGDKSLLKLLDEYYASFPDEPLISYLPALSGGSRRRGQVIFNTHEAAQCLLCHSIYESVGLSGPSLAGVGSRLFEREILESLLFPSARLAKGYAIVCLNLLDGEVVAGRVKSENGNTITVQKGNKEVEVVNKSNILERTDIPSSMPDIRGILTKSEIRDLVAFLKRLKI